MLYCGRICTPQELKLVNVQQLLNKEYIIIQARI